MTCVAVTRGGHGDVWLFDTRTEAYLHPLVQYGDALLCSPDDIVRQYPAMEWSSLRVLAGMPDAIIQRSTPSKTRLAMELDAPRIFEELTARASRPPSDPRVVCEIVSRDRRIGSIMAKKKETAAATEHEGAEKAETKTGGLNIVRGPKGVPLDAVIHMGKDNQGVAYGPDNNPKKVGSKTHGRFALYVHGMTIQQALDAGIPTGDLVYDQGHGFIKFHGGTAGSKPAPAHESKHEEPAQGTDQDADEAA